MNQREMNVLMLTAQRRAKKIFDDWMAQYERRDRKGLAPADLERSLNQVQSMMEPQDGEANLYGPDER